MAAATAVHLCSEDRSVKAFGPDGLRRRKLFSQESARWLADHKAVIAVWDRRRLRILTIHFYGDSRIPLKSRLKAGTRYSFQEQVADRRAWTHKRLPYQAIDAQTGFVEPPEVIDHHLRLLFQSVATSIIRADVPQPTVMQRLAPVISIDSARAKMRSKPSPGEVIAFPAQQAA